MDLRAVEVENISKKFALGEKFAADTLYGSIKNLFGQRRAPREFWALRDVSFSVSRGEAFGIIGRNGSGKSTLLKILARVTLPTAGVARMRGQVASLLEIGTGFNQELTGRENVFLNGAILGMRRAEIKERFKDIVEFAEIGKFLDSPVKHYSSGMYMRLAFSIAAYLESEILLVDEVLAVGDVRFQEKSLSRMEKIVSAGRTVLFVSHNPAAVQKLCKRSLLLEGGKIKAIGKTGDVIAKYIGREVRQRSVVDISRLESDFGNKEIVPLRISIQNPVGEAFAVYWDEPLKLRLKVKVNSDLTDVSFGIGCAALDNSPLFTVRSSDDGSSAGRRLSRNQVFEILVTIDHNLSPGLYNLALGVNSGEKIYFYNPHVVQVEVKDGGVRHYPVGNPGLVHCQSRWAYEKN